MLEGNGEARHQAAVEDAARKIFEAMKLGQKPAKLEGEVGVRAGELWAAHLAAEKNAFANAKTLQVERAGGDARESPDRSREEAVHAILADMHMKTWVAVLTGRDFSQRALMAEEDVTELQRHYPTRSDFMGEEAGDIVRKFLPKISVQNGNVAAAEQKRAQYAHALGTLADLLYGEVRTGQRRKRIDIQL